MAYYDAKRGLLLSNTWPFEQQLANACVLMVIPL